MKEKSRSITSKFWTFSALAGILILWQAVSWAGLVPHYMLPSPVDVVKAFFADFGLLMQHARVTLFAAAANSKRTLVTNSGERSLQSFTDL